MKKCTLFELQSNSSRYFALEKEDGFSTVYLLELIRKGKAYCYDIYNNKFLNFPEDTEVVCVDVEIRFRIPGTGYVFSTEEKVGEQRGG